VGIPRFILPQIARIRSTMEIQHKATRINLFSVATPQMRNWDLPQRRQIFSGVRLAWDA